MAPKGSAHAVYGPKYRKEVLIGEVVEAAREILDATAEAYDMEIDPLEVMEDHVHVFLSSPPRYSLARVIQILKSVFARELFAHFPWVRRKLWGGELWGDGYFVRSVGDQVAAEIIRRYKRYQKNARNIQLELWDESS